MSYYSTGSERPHRSCPLADNVHMLSISTADKSACQSTPFPKSAYFYWGPGRVPTQAYYVVQWAPRVHIPNGISIGSAVTSLIIHIGG